MYIYLFIYLLVVFCFLFYFFLQKRKKKKKIPYIYLFTSLNIYIVVHFFFCCTEKHPMWSRKTVFALRVRRGIPVATDTNRSAYGPSRRYFHHRVLGVWCDASVAPSSQIRRWRGSATPLSSSSTTFPHASAPLSYALRFPSQVSCMCGPMAAEMLPTLPLVTATSSCPRFARRFLFSGGIEPKSGGGCGGAFRRSFPTLARADVSPALAADLDKIISHQRIVLFLTGSPEHPRCRFTVQLVELFDQLGVEYGYFNILTDDEVCEGLKVYSEWPTYPQVYIDGELLGGMDVLKEMMVSGDLTAMLKEKALLPE